MSRMTDAKWAKELARIEKRIARLKAMMAGRVDVQKVPVKGHWVKRHYVEEHVRVIPVGEA
jgi:hypothetical protein